MELQNILFGTWTPPDIASRVHRVGFANSSPYIPPKKRDHVTAKDEKDPNKLTGSKLLIYKFLKKQTKPVPASAVEKKLHYTRNHCSIIMADLCKMGMLERKKLQANGTRYYVYEVKK